MSNYTNLADNNSRHKFFAKQKIGLGLAILVTLFLVGYAYLQSATYRPSKAAQTAAQSAIASRDATTFTANQQKDKHLTIIFYPGALVEANAYSIWAKQVAAAGYTVKIVHFPLNLAILKPNAAQNMTKQHYVIGGHSLGGVMAARNAVQHQKQVRGIFFLAAYPDQKGDLSGLKIPALSITGTQDRVLKWSNYRRNQRYLPKKTEFVSLKGANHAGFGSYGKQRKDGQAKISNQRQQVLIAKTLINWLKKSRP